MNESKKCTNPDCGLSSRLLSSCLFAQSHNIIINHFICRPLNVKKLKINFFLTHFYILITIYSCHFFGFLSFFFCRRYNDLLFLIQLNFLLCLCMMMLKKSSFNGNWKKEFRNCPNNFFAARWCLMCKKRVFLSSLASALASTSAFLNLLTRISN